MVERRLAAAGVRSPGLDAELLLRYVTGWSRADIVVRNREQLVDDIAKRFEALVAERCARRPLQHIIGRQAFWKHDFLVSPAVLIPRPETELAVEASLEALAGREKPVVVDVGTGSGCIAISIGLERRDARVFGVDLSTDALALAVRNAQRLGAGIGFCRGDLLSGFRDGSADLVVSNPPYIEAGEVDALEPEVRDHDPRIALVPAEGPAALYGRLCRQAARVLRPGGAVVLEMGAGQPELVRKALAAAGMSPAREIADLQGIVRTAVAFREGLG